MKVCLDKDDDVVVGWRGSKKKSHPTKKYIHIPYIEIFYMARC